MTVRAEARHRAGGAGPLGRVRPVGLGAEHVLALYLASLMLIPSQLVVRQLGSPGTPANLVGIGALVWWALATLGGLNRTRGLTPLRVGMAALTLAVLASYAAATAQGWWAPADLRQATDEDWTLVPVPVAELTSVMLTALDRGVLFFAGWAGVVMLAGEGLRSWRAVNVVVDWFVRLAAVVAALAIAQYYLDVDLAALITIPGLSSDSGIGAIDSRSVVNRVSSTARHPIELGVVMAVSFLLALHRAIFRRRLLPWVPVLLVGMALPMAVSRSSLLAFAVGGAVVLMAWPRPWRLRAFLLLPVAAVLVRLAAPGLLGTIRALFTYIGSDPSIAGRTDDYGPVLSLYAGNPLFGRGLFTFVPRYYRIVDNQGLVLLVELGLFGLLAAAVLHLAALMGARLAWKTAPSREKRLLAATLLGTLLSLGSSYAMFDTWGFPMAAGLTFLTIGLCGAVGAMSRRQDDPEEGSPGPTVRPDRLHRS